LDRLYPPLDKIVTGVARDNAILQEHLFIYASQGAGKTNTAMWLVEKAKERYGASNVHLHYARGEDFQDALENGWMKGKPIQILVLEDLTNVALKNGELRDFFRIRHKMAEKTGQREGLCLAIFTGHRFHDTPVALRADVDFILWRSSPSNPYDYNHVRQWIGDEAIKELEASEKHRLTEPERRGDTFITHKRERLGFATIPRIETPTIRHISTPQPSPQTWGTDMRHIVTPVAKLDRVSFRIRPTNGTRRLVAGVFAVLLGTFALVCFWHKTWDVGAIFTVLALAHSGLLAWDLKKKKP